MRPTINIISLGLGHAPAPRTDVPVIDMRPFRDPHVTPDMRNRTALDDDITTHVLNTPGVREHLDAAVAEIVSYATGPGRHQDTITVVTACVGGRHRAPAAAWRIGALLSNKGWDVNVDHRDLHRPVIER
ncbi:RapZ C-terminal domain-containing protein [Kitasatospora griseola]|uniref:RapZ C-terminal domain-containing protein n=1 Tax=Kitasatospora griseola TaxID=2064 RepID=UPI003662A4DA